MSHPDEGVLQELLDGELAPAEAAVIRIHLAGCASLRRRIAGTGRMQAEADAIVARLPLDPPLEQLALRGAGPAACQPAHARAGRQCRARGRDFVDALPISQPGRLFPGKRTTRPRAWRCRCRCQARSGRRSRPPRVRRRRLHQQPAPTAGGADQDESAKQATPQGEKKEKDAGGIRESELTPGQPRTARGWRDAAAESFRRLPSAQRTPSTATTVAGAEARLGTRLRTISGLTPVSVEVLPVAADSLLTVRQRYVVGGVTVLLVQQALPAPRDEVTSKANEPVPKCR